MVTNVSRPSQDPILDPVRFSQDMMEASCVWLDTSFAQLAPKKIRTAGASNDGACHCQWEFQDPKMEVPTIYKAYIRPM
jgi:hypothetical protein